MTAIESYISKEEGIKDSLSMIKESSSLKFRFSERI
jgi:hypothetical protein